MFAKLRLLSFRYFPSVKWTLPLIRNDRTNRFYLIAIEPCDPTKQVKSVKVMERWRGCWSKAKKRRGKLVDLEKILGPAMKPPRGAQQQIDRVHGTKSKREGAKERRFTIYPEATFSPSSRFCRLKRRQERNAVYPSFCTDAKGEQEWRIKRWNKKPIM